MLGIVGVHFIRRVLFGEADRARVENARWAPKGMADVVKADESDEPRGLDIESGQANP